MTDGIYYILFGLPFFLTYVNVKSQRKNVGKNYLLNTFLIYFLFFQVGVQAMLTGLIQIFLGEGECLRSGRCWSPYLIEVGMMNLSFGIGGILTYWLRGAFWVGIGGGYALYLLLSVFALSYEVLFLKGEGLLSLRPKALIDLLSALILFYLLFRRPKPREA